MFKFCKFSGKDKVAKVFMYIYVCGGGGGGWAGGEKGARGTVFRFNVQRVTLYFSMFLGRS